MVLTLDVSILLGFDVENHHVMATNVHYGTVIYSQHAWVDVRLDAVDLSGTEM